MSLTDVCLFVLATTMDNETQDENMSGGDSSDSDSSIQDDTQQEEITTLMKQVTLANY